MQTHNGLIGSAEACKIVNKDRATLTRWAADGKVKFHKMPGKTGALLFYRDEIEALAAERTEQAS